MKILITGGAGFIGSHLAQRLVRDYHEVIIFDDLSSGSLDNLSWFQGLLIRESILNQDAMNSALKGVEAVFHLAAFTSAPGSLDEPMGCVRLNNAGLLCVMNGMREAGCGKIVLASSAAIYGNEPTVPKVETMAPCPESVYALSKYDGEVYLALLAEKWGFKATSLRFFNVFGPRQNPDSGYAAAIPNFCKRASLGDEIVIHGQGDQTRDFIYVEDLVEALVHVVENATEEKVFNVGYGKSITVNSLVQSILALSGSSSEVRHTDVRQGDVKHSLADSSRLMETGWIPQIGFESGLRKTVEFYLAEVKKG